MEDIGGSGSFFAHFSQCGATPQLPNTSLHIMESLQFAGNSQVSAPVPDIIE